MSTFTESVRTKAEELELERRLGEFAGAAGVALQRALDLAADFAQRHRDDIATFLDRAGNAVDERTGSRYAGAVDRVKDGLNRGVSRIADRRH